MFGRSRHGASFQAARVPGASRSSDRDCGDYRNSRRTICANPTLPDRFAEDAANALSRIQEVTARLYPRVAPSLVAIGRVRQDRINLADPLRFNAPAGPLPIQDPTKVGFIPTELSCGIVISNQGDILTCYHVLDDPRQNRYYVWRVSPDGTRDSEPQIAQVQAGDPWTDLAVLRVPNLDAPPLPIAEHPDLKVGHFLLAAGDPRAIIDSGRPSLTLGMISNLHRSAPRETPPPAVGPQSRETIHEYGTLIQLDVRSDWTISGSAIVDFQGQLVGISTSLAATRGSERAAGYAIPLDESMRKAIDTMRAGKVPEFGFLGIEPVDIDARLKARGYHGALVRNVVRVFRVIARG